MIHQQRRIHARLAVFGAILWLIPIIISATTPVFVFSQWWVDFAIWRWFAPSYVGFQLLTAIGWHELRTSIKDPTHTNLPSLGLRT